MELGSLDQARGAKHVRLFFDFEIIRLLSSRGFLVFLQLEANAQLTLMESGGVGQAGMSAASRLLSNNVTFSAIEKENIIGGLAKAIRCDLFSLDIDPHILCAKPYVDEIASEIFKDLGGGSV